MTTPTPLSPAAEAVLDAALPHMVHRYAAAAALRAAANEVTPPGWLPSGETIIRRKLLAIAAELEAQPEPVRPTVMEIIALADEVEDEGLGQIDLVRRALARWGRPAALAQPEPVGPTDEEVEALVICVQGLPIPDANDLALPSIDRGREMVRQALARWGSPAAPPLGVEPGNTLLEVLRDEP